MIIINLRAPDMTHFRPLQIHKKYGLVDIPNVEVLKIEPGTNSKYKITVKYNNRTEVIPFGDPNYEHYRDRTPLANWQRLNHGDSVRRNSYLARASKIVDGTGRLTCNNPFSANRWSIILLW